MYDNITNQRTSVAFDEGAFKVEMEAFARANPNLEINIEEYKNDQSSPSFPKLINMSDQKNKSSQIILEERPTPTNVSNMKNIWKSYDIAVTGQANPPPTRRLPPNSNLLVSSPSPPSQIS